MASDALAPLADDPVVQLGIAGFGPATVQVPRGARSKRPVLVALHAHNIRPEQACADWRRASGEHPFVLCPFGVPATAGKNDPVTVGTADYTTREIQAGLEALRRRFGNYVADGPVLFAGYSLGAKVGAEVVRRMGKAVSAAVFGEGGYDALTPGVVDDFARAGMRRALLLCSTRACELSFAPSAVRLEQAGIVVRVVSARGTRHPFEGEVVETARRNWRWLVENDDRFLHDGKQDSNP